jgi:hypothetical protein
MIDFSRYGGHRGGRDLDTFEGGDIEDFYDQVEADEDDEYTGDIEDGGEALEAWREQQEDGDDELECGLTRAQLRTAAKVLFSGLSEVCDNILRVSRKRLSQDGTAGSRNGAVVSAAMVAGIAVALQLPRYEKSANVARSLRVTRAGVSLYAAKFGRMLGTTSEQSARKQVEGVLAMARSKAGLKPRVGPVVHAFTVVDRESPETREWLESLAPDEREEARKALRGKVA